MTLVDRKNSVFLRVHAHEALGDPRIAVATFKVDYNLWHAIDWVTYACWLPGRLESYAESLHVQLVARGEAAFTIEPGQGRVCKLRLLRSCVPGLCFRLQVVWLGQSITRLQPLTRGTLSLNR